MSDERLAGVGPSTGFDFDSAARPTVSLVGEAVSTALDSLAVLEAHSRELADALRCQQLSEVGRGLVQLVRGIRTLLTLASLTASAAQVNLESLCGREGLWPYDDLHAALDQILAEQIAGDWLALADTLDQVLPAALCQWRSVFELLGGSPMNPGNRT
jgi:hypothetical protein